MFSDTGITQETINTKLQGANQAGAIATIKVTNENIEKFNENKLYVSYFCNEDKKENA